MNDFIKEYVNDTLEEELRRQLIEQHDVIKELKTKITLLEEEVRSESIQKYNAYTRIQELISQLRDQKLDDYK